MEHSFVFRYCLVPRLCELDQLFELVKCENYGSREHCLALGVQGENKLRHDSKVGASSSDRPEEVWIFSLAGNENGAIRRDDGDLNEKAS
jgi:hypothetical protein